jgi:hypothetical protein
MTGVRREVGVRWRLIAAGLRLRFFVAFVLLCRLIASTQRHAGGMV